ncbi:hypothetical protein [Neptuniibacter sp. QD48_11]|uniref:hypothetical protein n=1 Tax=Neptuniibacter sp. QD48_11 TaxID=3398211 RepID=UPI0039F6360A
MDYNWKCRVCNTPNDKGKDYCINCRSSAVLNPTEVKERQYALQNGEAIDDEAGLPVRELLPENSMWLWATDVSMGRNPTTKKLGVLTSYILAFLFGLVFLRSIFLANEVPGYAYGALIFLGIACIEIRNFFSGRTTYTSYICSTAKHKNTLARWIGLLFDFFYIWFAFEILASIQT